jgi:hypothetical protein
MVGREGLEEVGERGGSGDNFSPLYPICHYVCHISFSPRVVQNVPHFPPFPPQGRRVVLSKMPLCSVPLRGAVAAPLRGHPYLLFFGAHFARPWPATTCRRSAGPYLAATVRFSPCWFWCPTKALTGPGARPTLQIASRAIVELPLSGPSNPRQKPARVFPSKMRPLTAIDRRHLAGGAAGAPVDL